MTIATKKSLSAPRPRGRPKVRPDRLVSARGAARRAASADDGEERIYQAVLQSVLGQRLTPGTKLHLEDLWARGAPWKVW